MKRKSKNYSKRKITEKETEGENKGKINEVTRTKQKQGEEV